MLRTPCEGDPILTAAKTVAKAMTRWHKARVEGSERIPDGPAILVGNHGLYGFESPVFFWLVRQATGRYPIGMADRVFFSNPPCRYVLERIGGVVGTRENALACLREGHLVVCYPGGSREVFKERHRRYRLQWDRSLGFARLALAAQVPVLPFAGIGVDDSYVHLGHLPRTRELFGRYAIPVGLGLGPLPLPVHFTFRFGAPLPPPSDASELEPLRDAARRSVESLLGVPDAAPPPAAALVR